MKILLIDDQPDVMQSLKDAIEPAGHECVLYQNPAEAVGRFQADHFDAVITDYKMPQMDGIRVLKAVQQSKPGIPVIILTGYADTEGAIEAVNNGAYAYFQKPVDIKRLFKTIAGLETPAFHVRAGGSRAHRLVRENQDLIREVNGRLNENLQMLYSLLRLEYDQISDPAVRAFLAKTFARIRVFSLVYQESYDHPENPGFRLDQFIQNYLGSLRAHYRTEERGIAFSWDLKPVSVDTETATAWGLGIHETVSNAVLHAFPEVFTGEKRIKVSLHRTSDHRILFTVHDNGIGLPGERILDRSTSIGLALVSGLVRDQLGGKIMIRRGPGTTLSFSVPEGSETPAGPPIETHSTQQKGV
ncbi:MAG: response regulator [bacterium]|nr:response regulator [bacterium]